MTKQPADTLHLLALSQTCFSPLVTVKAAEQSPYCAACIDRNCFLFKKRSIWISWLEITELSYSIPSIFIVNRYRLYFCSSTTHLHLTVCIMNRWWTLCLTLSLEQDLEFHGVMRFYFQDRVAGNFATKCIRVSSTATTQDVIETLAEKFRPDMRMLSSPKYSLYEVHVSGGESHRLEQRRRERGG